MAEEKNLEGLGGWLILVGMGIVLSPLRIIVLISPIYVEMFSSSSWDALTTAGSEAYHPLWAPILIGEMLLNGALVIAWLFIAFLFFTRKIAFPKVYIGVLLFSLVFILVDAVVIKAVIPNEPVFDPDTIKELARTLIAAFIWIPYMLVSKRVKATFTRRM